MPRRNSKAALPATAALALLTAAPLAAAQTVALAPLAGHPTQAVTLSGSGFANSEAVDIYIDTTDTLLLVASPTGTLSGAITIPATAQPGPHYITAIGRRSGDAAQKPFNVTTPWAQLSFGAAGQNNNIYENTISPSNVATLGLRWSTTNANNAGATPAISNGHVFVSTTAGLQALSTATGAVLWTALPGSSFFSSPSVPGNAVYVSDYASNMYALNFTTGAVTWTTTVGSYTLGSPVYAAGMVYIGCGDHKLYALSAATGKIAWTYTTGSNIDASPSVVAGVVYVGSEDHSLYALNATTGALLWSYATGSEIEATPAVANGLVYVASDDGKIYALRVAGSPIDSLPAGSLVWSNTGVTFAAPAVADGMVFYGLNTLYAANARTGAVAWSFAPDTQLRGHVLVANGVVYATSTSGQLYALAESTGAELGHAQTGSPFTGGAAIADGVIYVNAYDTGTVAYALHAGSDTARPRPPARATLHPDMQLKVTPREP